MKIKEKIVLVFNIWRSLQTSKNYLLIWRQVYKILKIYALRNTTYLSLVHKDRNFSTCSEASRCWWFKNISANILAISYSSDHLLLKRT